MTNESVSQLLQKAMSLHTSGAYRDAEILYRKVLEIHPDHPDAIHFIGVLAFNVGNLPAAKEYLNRAIELLPSNAGCYNNMGNVYQQEGNFIEAIKYYEQTLKYDPGHYLAYNNLGVANLRTGKYQKAKECLKKALSLAPEYAGAHNNLGESYSYLGDYEKAFLCYEKAVSLEPQLVDAHWNRALSLLLRGRLAEGFEGYEWRWKRQDTPRRDIDPSKRWKGEPLKGKLLFVYEEQGLGDALQFIRYLPKLKALEADIVFEASPALVRLFEPLEYIDKLWVRNTRKSTVHMDRYDYHCPVLSLPGMMGTRLETIPDHVPYFSADKAMAASWEKRLKHIQGMKIGIAWAGNPDHRNDHNRSCLLSEFKTLASISGVALIGLQKDKYENWTDIDPDTVLAWDAGNDLHDFADTAALLENLDMVIGVDTALVHLAGGMGKKVWTLLPFFPDWRWMLDRPDSPWYPSMKLFRQEKTGGWQNVFREIEKNLRDEIEIYSCDA